MRDGVIFSTALVYQVGDELGERRLTVLPRHGCLVGTSVGATEISIDNLNDLIVPV